MRTSHGGRDMHLRGSWHHLLSVLVGVLRLEAEKDGGFDAGCTSSTRGRREGRLGRSIRLIYDKASSAEEKGKA
jgi:hypothetical protein